MQLKMVDDAGHSAKEPGIRKLLVEVSAVVSMPLRCGD